MISAAQIAPAFRQSARDRPPNSAMEEPGGEQVARSGGIDHALDRFGKHLRALAARHGHCALLAAGDDQRRHLGRKRGQPRIEVVLAGQRGEFMLR